MEQLIAAKKLADSTMPASTSALQKGSLFVTNLDAIAIAKLVSLSEAAEIRKGNRAPRRRNGQNRLN